MRVYFDHHVICNNSHLTSRIGRTLQRFKSRRLLCVNTHEMITTLIIMKSNTLFCLIKLQQKPFYVLNNSYNFFFLLLQHFKISLIYLVVMCCEYFKTVNLVKIKVLVKLVIALLKFVMLYVYKTETIIHTFS